MGRAEPTGQLGQPGLLHRQAEVLAQAVVAFPLGFVERLIAGGLVRKVLVLLRIGQHVHVQGHVQVGLDHQQCALGAHRHHLPIGLLDRALAVTDARQQHATARVVVGHVLG